MLKKNIKTFGGDRKFFAIVFSIFLLLALSLFVKPYLESYINRNWHTEEEENNKSIESDVKSLYKEKENSLLETAFQLKSNLTDTLKPGKNSYGSLVKLVNSKEFSSYSIEIVAPNGRLIAWNENIAIPQYDIFPLNFPAGEVYFYNSSLDIYLSYTDTLSVQNDLFYIIVSRPFEKKYYLQNPYYADINFSKLISDRYLTQFNINYSSSGQIRNDSTNFSFELLNNKNNKIAVVTFIKPSIGTSVSSVDDIVEQVQSVLVIIALIFIALGFRNKFKEIESKSVKFLIVIFYCVLFRVIIFYIGFPSNFIDGALTDPSYFSSAFGGGIVKSPVEFFISNLFFLIISIQGFRYLSGYLEYKLDRGGKEKLSILLMIIIPVSILFFLTLRGLTAALKSVIFDSTLRYFKEPNIIPNLPAFVMNINILMLGLSSVIFLLCFLFITIPFFYSPNRRKLNIRFLFIYLFFQTAGIIFLIIQREPLLTPVLSLIFVTLIFILLYHTAFIKINSVYNFVYSTLAASIIAITLLNFFNLKLEKESLKTTALEMNRPNNNLFRFLINETLSDANQNAKIKKALANINTNYDATAFIIWANSSLQKESINSSIDILNNNGELLGSFSVGLETPDFSRLNFSSINKDFDTSGIKERPLISEYNDLNSGNTNVLIGFIPFTNDSIQLGYISVAVELNEEDFVNNNIPEFLESKKNYLNNVIDVNQLKIFEFSGGKLRKVFGDIYPSTEEVEPILNVKFRKYNDAWLNLSLSGETYFTYILKTGSNGKSIITAVALREKDISWNLFNFFKIFILHSLLIICLFFVLFLTNLKNFKYSFRIQLLIAFLSISILPVIILAVYNRQVVEQRSESAVFEELSERSDYVVNQVTYLMKENPQLNFSDAFYYAAKELNISFSVYEFTNQVYSSREQYYDSGLFDYRLNPQAYYNLYYLTYREYLTKEKIENYTYNAFYKKVNIEGKDFIIGVNDAFNKVKLIFSTIDIDVFLFGIYSFAAIIIIIISTILANRISSPIRRLTKATDSVAHGDLNIELDNKEKGEMRELFQSFNIMTTELRKNQVEISEMERENAWKEMAKQVAHEIKNPLTPMKLAVQQLIISYKDKTKNFDTIFEKVSSTILNQIENLSLIASEFSRFAKMPSLKLETLDLLSIVDETANLFAEEKVKIYINTNLSSAVVEADKTQLRRLFINLVRNAIQASASVVEITVAAEENDYIITLKDNGNGIPEEAKEKIFDSNFTTKEKGMGLGLKLAKRFLESINGKIFLLESSEKGTTFRLQIPVSSRV
ncbi:MAG: ATP-binding protein [Ignavibacteriaceae bacterium]